MPLTRDQLITEITTDIFTNTGQLISGNLLQGVLIDMVNSLANLITDANQLTGLSEYQPSQVYSYQQGFLYQDKLYQVTNMAGTTGAFAPVDSTAIISSTAIGSGVTGGNPMDILFIDTSGNLAQSNALRWNYNSSTLNIGQTGISAFADSSSVANNGIPNSTIPLSVTSPFSGFSQALQFSNIAGEGFSIGSNAYSLASVPIQTHSFKLYFTDVTKQGGIFQKASSNADGYQFYLVYGSGVLGLVINGNNGTSQITLNCSNIGGGPFVNNTAYDISVVIDTTNFKAGVSINGTVNAARTGFGFASPIDTEAGLFSVGACPASGSNDSSAIIMDEYVVRNYALFIPGTDTTCPVFNTPVTAGSGIIGLFHFDSATTINSRIQYIDGNQAAGYVFTSDANGMGTWQNPGSSILNTVLTGFSASDTAISATDTILQGFDHAQGQITFITNNYVPLAGGVIMTGPLILSGDPTMTYGAATKNYVDQLLNGLKWKHSVIASTTGALPSYTTSSDFITLTATANGTFPTQDGVILILNDYLLVKNEAGSLKTNHGSYRLTQLGNGSAPWILTRSPDSNSSILLQSATYTIREGATQATQTYTVNVDPVTLGTTLITFGLTNGPGTYTNGTYLSLIGNVFNIDFTKFTSDQVTPGVTNLYFTNALARGAISGTTNRIAYNSSTGVINIDPAYVGQASITTLGTIGSGIWNGTLIGNLYGGTGTATVFTAGSLVYAGASGVYSQDNANLFYDATNARMYLGANSGGTGRLYISEPNATNALLSVVAANGTNAATLMLQAAGSGSAGMRVQANATNVSLTTTTSSPMVFQINFSTKMIIDTSGNLAIGNTTALPVTYPSLFSVGTASQFQVTGSGDIGAIRGVPYSFPSAQGSVGTFLRNDSAGNLTWVSAVPTAGGTMTGALILNANASNALGAVTLQQLNAAVLGVYSLQGGYNASGNTFPVASNTTNPVSANIVEGMIWIITTGGTLGGTQVYQGDEVVALMASPGQTSTNWSIINHGIGYVPITNVLNSAQILVGNASNIAAPVTMSGNVTISNAGVTTIGASQVTNAMLAGSIDLTSKVINVLAPVNGGSGTSTLFTANNVVIAGASGIYTQSNSFRFDPTNITLAIGSALFTPTTITAVPFSAVQSQNTFVQCVIQNLSSAANASIDFIGTADTGSDSLNYFDIGMNCSGNTSGTWGNALDVYFYASNGALGMGTQSAGKSVNFYAGGDLAANIIMSLSSAALTITDGINMVFGTTAGTQIGTSATQKFALYGKTPIIQPASANQASVAAQTQQSLTDNTAGTVSTTLAAIPAVAAPTLLANSAALADTNAALAVIRNTISSMAAQEAKIKADIAAMKVLQDQTRLDLIAFGNQKGSA